MTMNGIDISWYLILSMCIGVALVLYVIIKIIMNIKRNAKQNVNTKKDRISDLFFFYIYI